TGEARRAGGSRGIPGRGPGLLRRAGERPAQPGGPAGLPAGQQRDRERRRGPRGRRGGPRAPRPPAPLLHRRAADRAAARREPGLTPRTGRKAIDVTSRAYLGNRRNIDRFGRPAERDGWRLGCRWAAVSGWMICVDYSEAVTAFFTTREDGTPVPEAVASGSP